MPKHGVLGSLYGSLCAKLTASAQIALTKGNWQGQTGLSGTHGACTVLFPEPLDLSKRCFNQGYEQEHAAIASFPFAGPAVARRISRARFEQV